jgi:hypothetical protein
MPTRNERTFFVEGYVPQLDAATVAVLSARLQTAVEELRQEGLPLAWIRSFALLNEDTYVWMIKAAEPEHVVLIQRRAGVEFDHIAEATPDETPHASP